VNQYESEQVSSLLRSRGLIEAPSVDQAELRIINSCSVTMQAASQSRQTVRRSTRLPVLSAPPGGVADKPEAWKAPSETGQGLPLFANQANVTRRPRVVVIGCWATSDKAAAGEIEGVDAVLTHQDDLAAELDRLLALWQSEDLKTRGLSVKHDAISDDPPHAMKDNNGDQKAGAATENRNPANKPILGGIVNDISGSARLPLLVQHQSGRQRALLKIQDGCDAHCTYCIIPQLRPNLWSKPIDDAVEEARRMVRAGHVEIVLTGIFLGAYGQSTALRRRQPVGSGSSPLAKLVHALCERVPGLERLRLSSLEPGDLGDDLLRVLASHRQVVPHFHLPLQSGSDLLLRRMNRQYRKDDFLSLVERISGAFDRPALTTDIIVGFPGESAEQFQHTLDAAHAARFIHIHAFPYSPRPGTAAARWKEDFVPGSIANDRIRQLTQLSRTFSYEFRQRFVGSEVEVIVEGGFAPAETPGHRRGRCERYFAVEFNGDGLKPGDVARVRVDEVTLDRTFGTLAGKVER